MQNKFFSDLSIWRGGATLCGGLPRRGGGPRGDQASDRAVCPSGQHGHLQRRHLQCYHLQAWVDHRQDIYFTEAKQQPGLRNWWYANYVLLQIVTMLLLNLMSWNSLHFLVGPLFTTLAACVVTKECRRAHTKIVSFYLYIFLILLYLIISQLRQAL